MPNTDELYNDVPSIPDTDPTPEALRAEAEALGDSFVEVNAHPAEIAADADEMLGGEEDLPAFAAGEYPVTARHFLRLRNLRALLPSTSAGRERNDEVRQRYTENAEKRRNRLLVIRRRIGVQARAARLPASLFSLGKINTTRLGPVMWRTDEVLENTRALHGRFANKPLIDKLVSEGTELVTAIKAERRALGLMTDQSVGTTRFQRQIERLLVDTMRHIGAQGLACFDEDRTREARYRLDHVYARRTTPDSPAEPELPPAPADDGTDE